MVIRSAYSPRLRVQVSFEGPNGVSRTRQSEEPATNIENIVKRYRKSGVLTHLAETPGMFADVSEMGDYRTAIEQVRSAERSFNQLPAKVRARFGNDPLHFLDYMTEGGHEDELKALGLWAEGKGVEPTRAPEPPVDPSPPGGGSVRDPDTGRFV